MKKQILIALFALLLGTHSHAQSWSQKADFPTISSTATAFAIGGKGYVYGGSARKNYEYNPSANTWTEKGPIPIEGGYEISFVVGNKAYVGLSAIGASGIKDSIFEYDPVSDSYTFKTLFPGTSNSPNSIGARAFAIGNKAYICVGAYGNPEMWEYNVSTNSWAQKTAPSFALNPTSAAFVLNNKGYLCRPSSLAEYDPTSDTWSFKAALPAANGRSGHSSFIIGNFAYAGAGKNNANQDLRDFYKYDPTTNTWTPIDTIPGNASSAITFNIGNQAYCTLGSEGWFGFSTKTWAYSDGSTTSVADFTQLNRSVWVFPNPNNGRFTIQANYPAEFELLDLNGRVLKKYALKTDLSETFHENLPAGMYLLRDKSNNSTKKLIIE